MSLIEAVPEVVWTRIIDLTNSLVTVAVAVLVALIATKRETRKQLAQRHFEFRDQRANIYADIIEKSNTVIFLYLEHLDPRRSSSEENIKVTNRAAMDLETAAYKGQIHVPEFVAHACLNFNGRMQHLVHSLESHDRPSMEELEFEQSKRNMLKVMKVDIRLIEKTSDRTQYMRLAEKEGSRYFSESGLEEPTK